MSGKTKKLLIAEHSLLFCYSFTSKLISSKNIRYLRKMINLLNIYCSSDEKYWWILVLGISKKIKRNWQKRDLWHCMSKRVKSIFQSEDPCSLPSIICKKKFDHVRKDIYTLEKVGIQIQDEHPDNLDVQIKVKNH